MGSLHSIQDQALAQLRARLGAAEEDNQDLIAFARGHHGAVAAIHRAVLMLMTSRDFPALCEIVTQLWPGVLGIDHCALAIADGPSAMLAAHGSLAPLDPSILARSTRGLAPVTLRNADRGHILFGPHCDFIRAEALIRVETDGAPAGLLLLGQGHSPGLEECCGGELLRFLGQSVGAMIGPWRRGATA